MTNTNIQQINPKSAKRTQIIYGFVLIVVGLLIYLLFGLNTEAGVLTTFGLNLASSQAIKIPDLVLPALTTVYLMAAIAAMYSIVTIAGMLIWIRIVYKGLLKLNWHKWEHNAGIITGLILIITGIISFFIN